MKKKHTCPTRFPGCDECGEGSERQATEPREGIPDSAYSLSWRFDRFRRRAYSRVGDPNRSIIEATAKLQLRPKQCGMGAEE